MQNKNDWLFDAIWELSDKSHDAGLSGLAEKLEEAMDVFLAEHQLANEIASKSEIIVQQPKQTVQSPVQIASKAVERRARKVPSLARLNAMRPDNAQHPRANRIVGR